MKLQLLLDNLLLSRWLLLHKLKLAQQLLLSLLIKLISPRLFLLEIALIQLSTKLSNQLVPTFR